MVSRRPPARVDELLSASMRAFAARGYFGTSTADVAVQMGVSQPYVIQTFGTKRELFIRTHAHAGALIVERFRSAGRFDPQRLGAVYRELVLSRPAAVLVHAHAFSAAAAEPAIGAEARRLFDEVYGVLRAAGGTDDEIEVFVARGMLINNLLLMEAARYADDHDFRPLVDLLLGRRPASSPAPAPSVPPTIADQESR